MFNGNTTACIRIPFSLTGGQLAGIGCLTLGMKYDDGFVAYLNGTEVASANAPGSPVWNSAATIGHPDGEAVVFEDFSINAYIGELVVGTNVLAIHGLNVTNTSSDFLISAELEAFSTCSSPPSIAPGAIAYSGPFALSETTHVKSRVLDGGVWSALNEATFVTTDFTGDLRITEIMYNPLNPLAEFIELKNIGTSPINLVDTAFTEGIHFVFPDMVLAPEAFALVVKDTAAFTSVYGGGYPVAGEYTGSLDNAGERIRLEDPTGAEIHDFRYKDGWYDITDGGGYSLTIRHPTSGWLGGWNDKAGWRASALAGGSPGALDWVYVPGVVVINEVLAHSHAAAPDWIELHNTVGVSVNIGGWFLSDSSLDLRRYEIASGTTIPAGGYIVFYEDLDFGNAGDPGSNSPFGLSENGETVYLSSGSGGVVTGYRDKEDFGASDRDVAFGRYLKNDGTFNFVSMSSKTIGAANAYPKVGPVVINEIMYRPGTVDEEYVELRNTTGSTVNLYDGSNPWIFSDGITFTFPPGTTIPANGFLLVAKDPTAFAATYSPPGGVVVLGPYAGQLDNGGEKLELAKPGDLDGAGVRQYIRVDRVNYDDVAPWPTGPDGGGTSLTRKVTTNYGNDVANWQEAAPSPGL